MDKIISNGLFSNYSEVIRGALFLCDYIGLEKVNDEPQIDYKKSYAERVNSRPLTVTLADDYKDFSQLSPHTKACLRGLEKLIIEKKLLLHEGQAQLSFNINNNVAAKLSDLVSKKVLNFSELMRLAVMGHYYTGMSININNGNSEPVKSQSVRMFSLFYDLIKAEALSLNVEKTLIINKCLEKAIELIETKSALN